MNSFQSDFYSLKLLNHFVGKVLKLFKTKNYLKQVEHARQDSSNKEFPDSRFFSLQKKKIQDFSLSYVSYVSSQTDKATLLAKVVQRVNELKQQTLDISKETVPSETDEISVLNFEDCSNEDGRIIFKVSFCCEDRPDLMKDLVETLRSLRMETVYAYMTTIGGRTRNDLVVVGNKEQHSVESVTLLQNALKSLLERSNQSVMMGHGGGEERSKRRRPVDHIIRV